MITALSLFFVKFQFKNIMFIYFLNFDILHSLNKILWSFSQFNRCIIMIFRDPFGFKGVSFLL